MVARFLTDFVPPGAPIKSARNLATSLIKNELYKFFDQLDRVTRLPDPKKI